MANYEAREGAPHSCCHDAEIVDLDKLDSFGDPEFVCECHDLETAERIATALNAFYNP